MGGGATPFLTTPIDKVALGQIWEMPMHLGGLCMESPARCTSGGSEHGVFFFGGVFFFFAFFRGRRKSEIFLAQSPPTLTLRQLSAQ